jgi:hypothetical protein
MAARLDASLYADIPDDGVVLDSSLMRSSFSALTVSPAPTVLDRLIQQAMHQVLMPIFDPGFSNSSYGFRPGRSAHAAVLAARGNPRKD